ncbi:NUDIX hydrolase [Rhodococcus phenolicus]|uniref:NUDIX hydrolase n=1 Tax=Rhodococcus phenolicus TaxID=263849 RepID=UPI00082976A8|nr:NUDIX domain-containing protein [Rhodococcus phenolicus]
MKPAVRSVHEIVSAVEPWDDLERSHRSAALEWIAGTDDVFRRRSPATPPQHLVSYVVVVDPSEASVFLVDHIKAGLWLPAGGHVEPGEHPRDTAIREVREELGIEADFGVAGTAPLFLTVTNTVGSGAAHVDVSLWYAVAAGSGTEFALDPREFRGGRWWTADEMAGSDPTRFDPHFLRFIAKLRSVTENSGAQATPRVVGTGG